jgi:hypothetical protein
MLTCECTLTAIANSSVCFLLKKLKTNCCDGGNSNLLQPTLNTRSAIVEHDVASGSADQDQGQGQRSADQDQQIHLNIPPTTQNTTQFETNNANNNIESTQPT